MVLVEERHEMEQTFIDRCTPFIEEKGLAIYDLEYIAGSTTLRIYIMNPESGNAVIEDCVKVDKALDPLFEEAWIPEDITLEVSSPGVNRKLRTREHFEAAIGERVNLRLIKKLTETDHPSLNGQSVLSAKLSEVNNNDLSLDFEGKAITLKFEDIKKAKLDPLI